MTWLVAKMKRFVDSKYYVKRAMLLNVIWHFSLMKYELQCIRLFMPELQHHAYL